MDYRAIQARIKALIELGGWSNAEPPPDYAFLANEGLRLFSRESQHNVEEITITTTAEQATYDLAGFDSDPETWISFFDDALWNSTTWISQTTRNNLRGDDRLWRSKPSGTPVWWYWSGPQQIGLYPKPSASAQTLNLAGPRHEPALSSETSTPLAPEIYHEGICLFAAWYWGKLYSRGEERQIAAAYHAEALDHAARCQQDLYSKDSGLIVRRVSRAPQEYMGLGSKQSPVFWP